MDAWEQEWSRRSQRADRNKTSSVAVCHQEGVYSMTVADVEGVCMYVRARTCRCICLVEPG